MLGAFEGCECSVLDLKISFLKSSFEWMSSGKFCFFNLIEMLHLCSFSLLVAVFISFIHPGYMGCYVLYSELYFINQNGSQVFFLLIKMYVSFSPISCKLK